MNPTNIQQTDRFDADCESDIDRVDIDLIHVENAADRRALLPEHIEKLCAIRDRLSKLVDS